jgi:hypothetical protein
MKISLRFSTTPADVISLPSSPSSNTALASYQLPPLARVKN